MKSTESKASKSASQLQTKSNGAFFGKENGGAFGPEHTSTQSPVQTRSSPAPFFNSNNAVQPKLEINPSDDVYEKEADAMADRVMQREHATPPAPPETSNGSNNEGGSPMKTMPLSNQISRLQRKRAFESPTPLELNTANLSPSDEMPLQRKAQNDATTDAPDGMDATLNSSRGQGSSLPKDTQGKMESGFGADFSNVKVHSDKDAAQMNNQIGARAFTHGNDIYFNKGEYKPGTSSGDHLLAHELTHTVQQGGSIKKKAIQKAKANSNLKDIKKAAPGEINKVKPPGAGYIEKSNKGLKLVFTKLVTKKYLSEDSGSWMPAGEIEFPTGERKTKQAKEWKDQVKQSVETQIDTLAGTADKSKPLTLSLKKSKKAGIVGTVPQLANESVVPGWSVKGVPALYDIEHMIDWQIAGPQADNPKNLILLDRTKNRQLGNEVRKNIIRTAATIIDAYRKDFSIDDDPTVALNMFNLFLKGKEAIDYQNEGLGEGQWYSIKHMTNAEPTKSPLQSKIVSVSDSDIPEKHFLLITSAKRPGYILPNNVSNVTIGAFKIISVKYNKSTDKVETITVEPIVTDPQSTLKPNKPGGLIEVPFDSPKEKTYKIQNSELNRNAAGALKEFIGGVKGLSPIQFDEPEIDGFDVKITGKIVSTLSIFKNADISFGYDNGIFFIRGVLDLTKLAESFPKPFQVTACSVIIEANSFEGLFIAGSARFKLGSFGEGMIAAKAGKNVEFRGSFNFDSKWFKPAEINFDYKNGKWGIGGTIGIEEGTIKGVKQATLSIKYADETFSADGNAKLDVPGIESVKLSASYNAGAGFKFVAAADLKKLPGIKSGSVTVSILSKGDEDIKLGVGGTAVPDFPGVPGLTSSLTVMYEDGIFDMRAKVGYKKGRFDGAVEVGVSNKVVDDKGQPQGEPQKGSNVVVFGYGSLTVDLFKGSKGTISVRLAPDKQLLVAGSFTVRNVKPFGDGVNIKKGKEFPTIKIPLVGVPGVSIFFEIGGGAYFTFNWDPLVLKELTISFTETNINEIETAQVNIHGEVASKAVAEAYMELKASLGAQVLIAEIKGSLAGQAGIGVEAEAGGAIDATWNNEKGLQLKEINASVAVNPKAIFRLKGSVSVDLDLWVTTINLYYKEWILAEGSADLSGLSLKVNFPLKFDENGDLIRPGFEQLNIEKPDFSGDQGKAALDGGINADAKKERKLAQDKLRQQIADDMRASRKDEDFSPSKYAEGLKKKYKDDEEMKAFIMASVEEEVSIQEHEEWEKLKTEVRKSELPLSQKMSRAMVFKIFYTRISASEYDAFITELQVAEQQKQEAARLAAQRPPAPAATI